MGLFDYSLRRPNIFRLLFTTPCPSRSPPPRHCPHLDECEGGVLDGLSRRHRRTNIIFYRKIQKKNLLFDALLRKQACSECVQTRTAAARRRRTARGRSLKFTYSGAGCCKSGDVVKPGASGIPLATCQKNCASEAKCVALSYLHSTKWCTTYKSCSSGVANGPGCQSGFKTYVKHNGLGKCAKVAYERGIYSPADHSYVWVCKREVTSHHDVGSWLHDVHRDVSWWRSMATSRGSGGARTSILFGSSV